MKYRLRKIGVWSAVKVSFIINAILGACMGFFMGVIFFFLGALFSQIPELPNGTDVSGLPFMGGIAMVFLLPLFYGFFMAVFNGIIVTAIACWLYNLISNLVGGIEWELDEVKPVTIAAPRAPAPAPPPPPPPSPEPKPPIDEGPDNPIRGEGGVDV
jgi:hypothetical protein